MKYRTKVEIVTDLLRVAVNGNAKKTRLMYGARLSYTQIEEYLAYMLEEGLIIKNPRTNSYSLTDQGTLCLNLSDELNHLIVHQKMSYSKSKFGITNINDI